METRDPLVGVELTPDRHQQYELCIRCAKNYATLPQFALVWSKASESWSMS